MRGSGDADMRGAEPRARGKAGREGGREGGMERRMKEEAMADPAKRRQGREGGRQGTRQALRLPPPQPGGRMRQQRDPITGDLSGTRPGVLSVFCKNSLPGK